MKMFSTTLRSEKSGYHTIRIVLNRSFAAAAQTQVQSSSERRPQLAPPTGLKCTRLPSGLLAATVDNNSPVTRVSLIFKAGTRYETPETRGVVHRLRNLIGLSTNHRSAINFNYHVASTGALLSASTTRDHFSYDVQIFRRNIGHAFRVLEELMSEPLRVSARELEFSAPQMQRELSLLKDDWLAYGLERLHASAYRTQSIGYSILSPKYAIGHHSVDQLKQFAKKYFTTGNAAVAVTGVDHEDVLAWGNNFFPLQKGASVATPEKPKFYGGELRKVQGKTNLTVVHFGAESVGLNDVKGTVVHTVLANVLGVGPLVKWSDGGQTRLAKAVKNATSNPFQVSASNIGYDGTGLFTISYTSHWDDSAAVAKAALGEIRAVAKQGVTDQELQAAKNRVKYRLLSLAENDDYVVEDLAVQAAVRQTDVHLTNDQVKAVDAVTAADIQQAAKNIVSGKLAMSSVGRLDKTPYLDEL